MKTFLQILLPILLFTISGCYQEQMENVDFVKIPKKTSIEIHGTIIDEIDGKPKPLEARFGIAANLISDRYECKDDKTCKMYIAGAILGYSYTGSENIKTNSDGIFDITLNIDTSFFETFSDTTNYYLRISKIEPIGLLGSYTGFYLFPDQKYFFDEAKGYNPCWSKVIESNFNNTAVYEIPIKNNDEAKLRLDLKFHSQCFDPDIGKYFRNK